MTYVILFFLIVFKTFVEFLPVLSTAHFILVSKLISSYSNLDVFNTSLEFLPVSLTTHLVLENEFINSNFNLDVILATAQIGITIGVCVYFRNTIKDIIINLFKRDKKYFLFCLNVIVATLPTFLVGLTLYSFIKKWCGSNVSIAIALFMGSVLMLVAEKIYKNNRNNDEQNKTDFYNLDFKSALKIGILQSLSLFTGFSRSGSTISGCLLSNFSRQNAVAMSFFLSIPVSLAGSLLSLYNNLDVVLNNYGIMLFCVILSFIFTILFCRGIIDFLKKNNLYIFIYYRIILGILLMLI